MDEFTFCFKGNRTYVHGTDLYNSICKYLADRGMEDPSHLDLWIRKITTHNLAGSILDVDAATLAPPAVVCQFDSGGRTHKLCLFEGDDPVECRYPYDEDRIVHSAQLSPETKAIRLTERLSFTLIEIVVALNKALVGELFQPATGKWYFTRLKLERPLPAGYASDVTVTFDNSFGLHLTRSRVVVDDVAYGDIFFSLV